MTNKFYTLSNSESMILITFPKDYDKEFFEQICLKAVSEYKSKLQGLTPRTLFEYLKENYGARAITAPYGFDLDKEIFVAYSPTEVN